VKLEAESDHPVSMFGNLASGKLPVVLADLVFEEQLGRL
jgi:hypothetical protein